jgi:hypothetical protein
LAANGLIVWPPLTVGLLSFGMGIGPAIVVGAALVLACIAWCRHRLPAAWETALVRRRVSLLAGAVAFVALARLSVFMADPHASQYSVLPHNVQFVRHSCLTAATEALSHIRLHRSGYASPATGSRIDGAFDPEPYYYPPQFLLAPAVMTHLIGTDDFIAIRRVWFAVQVLVAMGALFVIASYISGRAGLVCALAFPLVWLAPPVLLNLQIGNAQILAVALAIAGMVLLASGRTIVGSGLLASAILAKIFPAMLLVGLVRRGRRHQLLAVIAWMAVLTVVTIAAYGMQPMRDFAAIFPFISKGTVPYVASLIGDPNLAVANLSSYGFTRKLVGLHVLSSLTHDALYQRIYSLLVLLIAVTAALYRRSAHDDERSRLIDVAGWLAVLNLASFRSPFLPDAYGPVGTYFLLAVLVASVAKPTWWRGSLIALGWLALSPIAGVETLSFLPIKMALALTLVTQLGAFSLNVTCALARPLGALTRQTPDCDPAAIAL